MTDLDCGATRESGPPPARIRDVCAAAAQYVRSRQSRDGGFCFYRNEYLEESNLCDTYHAVATLSRLGEEIPRREAVIDFLRAFPAGRQSSHLYFLAFTSRMVMRERELDASMAREICALPITPPPDSTSELTPWLERTRMVVRLRRLVRFLPEAEQVSRYVEGLRGEDDGFGTRSNLWSTWLALDILSCCGTVSRTAETAAFVDRLQIPSLGFTAVPGSIQCNLDVIFSGVRCCSFLGLPVKFSENVLDWVLACQTRDGAIARAPGSLPDLELL